jgi:hypothetical protein
LIYSEEDIDFLALSDRRFEELCFDLLMKQGYKGLTWRQGGPDNGRDIEGRFSVTCPLVDSYDEKWFFECKRYKGGVPVTEIDSKLTWAEAEKAKHLMIITSSYLSNNTRTWLEKIAPQKPYTIHLIEGKRLKQLVLLYHDLMIEYFIDKYSKLLHDAQKNWLIHDLLPEPATLHILATNLDPAKLTGAELTFLLAAVLLGDSELTNWCDNNASFNMEHIFLHLKYRGNTTLPLLEQIGNFSSETWATSNSLSVAVLGICSAVMEWESIYLTTLFLNCHGEKHRALYLSLAFSDSEGVEMLCEVTGDFSTKIRYINDPNASKELRKAILKIRGLDLPDTCA